MMERIQIFDTTLRDGEQSPGASMTKEEKLRMAQQLEKLKVDVIEAGFPIASVGDFEGVKLVARTVKNVQVAGLARASIKDIDRAWEALRPAGERARIHTFIATSDIHMKHKLQMSREDVLAATAAAVGHARNLTANVEFSAEDATRSDLPFLARVLETAIRAGASVVNIPDTVGYTLPTEFKRIIGFLRENVSNIDQAIISVHCHNDLGLAVANSLAAVEAGARQVECTVNGIGERAGNCSLEEFVMALRTRNDLMPFQTGIETRQIVSSSKLLFALTGMMVQPNKAIVGENAFAHEAGIHQHGVLKEKSTYEIMTPESVGLSSNNLVLGKHSGRHAFKDRLSHLGYDLDHEQLDKVFARFKSLADRKKKIYDEDLDAIVLEELGPNKKRFKLIQMSVTSGSFAAPTATLEMRVDGKNRKTAVIGVGPVDATFKAVTQLTGFKPGLKHFMLGALTGGTDAQGDCTVRLEIDGRVVVGHGVHSDIIVASAKAFIDALNRYAAIEERMKVTY
jgi:2-isopropylmalate synthase